MSSKKTYKPPGSRRVTARKKESCLANLAKRHRQTSTTDAPVPETAHESSPAPSQSDSGPSAAHNETAAEDPRISTLNSTIYGQKKEYAELQAEMHRIAAELEEKKMELRNVNKWWNRELDGQLRKALQDSQERESQWKAEYEEVRRRTVSETVSRMRMEAELAKWKKRVSVLEKDLQEVTKTKMSEISSLRGQLEAEKGNRHALAQLHNSLQLSEYARTADTKRVECVEREVSRLQEEVKNLRKKEKALMIRVSRFDEQKARAVMKALDEHSTLYIKERGEISEPIREMIRDLACTCKVPVNHIFGVICAVAENLGMEVKGSFCKKSVERIVIEGGEAAKIQIIEEMLGSIGYVLAWDETALLNEDHESLFAHVQGKTLFLGINAVNNHTAASQLKNIQDELTEFLDVRNSSPHGQDSPATLAQLAKRWCGATSDHANDVKAAVRLGNNWAVECEREDRGGHTLEGMDSEKVACVLRDVKERMVLEAGGEGAWAKLSTEEKDDRGASAYKALKIRLGNDEFGKLTPTEQADVDLFLWTGCCCHKDLNAIRYGVEGQKTYWKENPQLPQPMKFLNKTSRQHASSGEAARKAAEDISDSGGAKLVDLVGSVVANKDDGKGWQREYKNWYVDEYGYAVAFPGVSHNRYGTVPRGATVIILDEKPLLTQLESVRDFRKSGKWGNIELNSFDGIRDQSTFTDLHSLALYNQSVSDLYMTEVRQRSNGLELIDFHESLIAFLERIIDNPDVLLSSQTSPEERSFNGKAWPRPELWYTIQSNIQHGRVPHLRENLVAFFRGVLRGWKRFTTEFERGGAIDKATTSQKQRAWRPPTNDHNEGAFGALRQSHHRSPNMTLLQRNSRWRYTRCGTKKWMKANLTDKTLNWLRKRARVIEGSGLERKRRLSLVRYKKQVVSDKREKWRKKLMKELAHKKELESLTVRTDVARVRSDKRLIKVAELDLQLDWHRVIRGRKIPKSGNKDDKLRYWAEAVEAYEKGDEESGEEVGVQEEGGTRELAEMLDLVDVEDQEFQV